MGAAIWAARKTAKGRAERKLARLPLSSTGHGAAVPFPFVDRKVIKDRFSDAEINEGIRKAPVEDVPLDGLHAIQHSVKAERVRQYIEDPALRPPKDENPRSATPTDHPIVIEAGGKRYLWDGHHRSTAASLEGAKTIKARVVRLGAASSGT